MTILFTATLDLTPDLKSWGIRDLYVILDSCSQNCLVCTVASGCSSCNSSYYLYQGICVSVCPTGTYSNLNTSSCLACAYQCLACNGSASACTQCPSGRQNAPTCSCAPGTYDTGTNSSVCAGKS
jgi:proprotein convertase subtilisin/kexin type 5